MQDTYLVRIDLDRLRNRLSDPDRAPLAPRHVRHWLADQGYTRAGKTDQFLAEDLEPLFEDEILFLQVANEYHGLVD